MDDTPTPKRRGRKPLAPEDRKREVVGFRMRTDVKEALEKTATEMGRSLSEQLEMMIDSVPKFQKNENILRDHINGLKKFNAELLSINDRSLRAVDEINKTNVAFRSMLIHSLRHIVQSYAVKEQNNDTLDFNQINSMIIELESVASKIMTRDEFTKHFEILEKRKKKGLSLLDLT